MRALGLMFLCAVTWPLPVSANDDPFLKAVSFALTGSDGGTIKVMDRRNCTFAVENDVFHLDRVETDRISLREFRNKLGDQWIVVELHGDKIVVRTTPPANLAPGLDQESIDKIRQKAPHLFETSTTTYSDYPLRLETSEKDRVARAWSYIYAHGCTGRKSPF